MLAVELIFRNKRKLLFGNDFCSRAAHQRQHIKAAKAMRSSLPVRHIHPRDIQHAACKAGSSND
jgi:hypothetical protein